MIHLPSADDTALFSQYDENSLEREILAEIKNSPETYSYSSPEALAFEVSLRSAIVRASEDLYQSRMGFAIFEKTRCNHEFWDRTSNGGFQLKDGVKGSAAIADIFHNGQKYATECATAMVIVYYKALLDLLGAEPFDRLFRSIYLMNWNIREPLLKAVATPKKVKDHIIGDRAYFNNPDVSPETPWWQGENVIILPDALYYGHGIGIRSADEIIRSLNKQRKENATTSAYLMSEAGRPDFKKLFAATNQAVPAAALSWSPFPPPISAGR